MGTPIEMDDLRVPPSPPCLETLSNGMFLDDSPLNMVVFHSILLDQHPKIVDALRHGPNSQVPAASQLKTMVGEVSKKCELFVCTYPLVI